MRTKECSCEPQLKQGVFVSTATPLTTGKAIHGDPDYSAVVCILKTDTGAVGHGMTFTLGRGNEIVKSAVESFRPYVVNTDIREVKFSAYLVIAKISIKIFASFGTYWKSLTCEEQLRWIGQ